ncbi:zinc finger BED domain-containing protein RICESLEEPER 2-like [Rhizophagus irregularis DAOM 181602=DAOM 197198]|nr:zinc finger BED domain-containing protein RICESLEEPER 2-like [Rhizophagus irregularis DAOM 181602=DAOM 197198]
MTNNNSMFEDQNNAKHLRQEEINDTINDESSGESETEIDYEEEHGESEKAELSDNKNVTWAKCRHCSYGKYKITGTGSSTGNLNRRLKTHLDKIDPSVQRQAEFIKKFIDGENKDSNTVFSNEIFWEMLAAWIAVDDQSFTVVECPEFHQVIRLCNPNVNLPSADTIQSDILNLYSIYRQDIKNQLQNSPGRLSFTLDGWTSPNNISFLSVTCHYIDKDWKINDILLDFICLKGSHSGENMAIEFSQCVKEFNILSKIIAITADNAANKDGIMILENNSEESNTIPKLKKLIIKINSSPQRRGRFLQHIKIFSELTSSNLILDVKTRWNLTFLMLKLALVLREALDDFIILQRDLNRFIITPEEWDMIKELCRVLEKFYKATEFMSSSQHITLSSSVLIYNILFDHLEKFVNETSAEYCHIEEIRLAINKGINKLSTYYSKTDESELYYISTILDPRCKLNYYKKNNWEQKYIDKATNIITDKYKEIYQSISNSLTDTDTTITTNTTNKNNFLFELFEFENNIEDIDELQDYLNKPSNETIYPRLANMARDYLGIPGTSVPVERIFSGGSDLITKKRSNLNIDSIRTCICLKNWKKYERKS